MVNCAAIPSGIIESELFGHKKGSFTGATENKKGYFEESHKGTIFLDEIGELPKETQSKLLRVIESGEFMRVGESKTHKVDVRIIAATNRDLYKEVKNDNFRKDLYFRLKTINVVVPSLRNHISDLHLYIDRFGLDFTLKNDIIFKGFSSDAINLLKQYKWPGNIRELKNMVESLIVMNKGNRIDGEMVKSQLNLNQNDDNGNSLIPVNDNSDKLERELMLKQLFYLRQDINEIKQFLMSEIKSSEIKPSNPALFLPLENSEKENTSVLKSDEINDATINAIKDDIIGELTMEELEREVIEKYLNKFKGNRRKTAEALEISERTLYRKIKEYEL